MITIVGLVVPLCPIAHSKNAGDAGAVFGFRRFTQRFSRISIRFHQVSRDLTGF
ncbi:MAG: hypothetical protein KJ065_10245 [Anaerolineae bacterium]|nr:hypothetical protein [Anaerolineae bacterium]